MLTTRLHAARAAIGPGPSRWRNAYRHHMHLHPQGVQTRSEWATLWASGHIAPPLVLIWSGSLVRPFYKRIEDHDRVTQYPAMIKGAL